MGCFNINTKNEINKTCIQCNINKSKSSVEYSNSIDASDIAVLLGLNKYNDNLHDIVLKYWRRGFPLSYYDMMEKVGNELIDVDENIENICIEKGISFDFKDIGDVDILECELNNEEIEHSENIKSFCNKQMGKQFEQNAIKQYEKNNNVIVEEYTKYIKKDFMKTTKCKWFLGGRVDGVINFDKIIEVKNRRKCFYHCIPIYEIIQIYTYMYVFDINQSSLIEQYQNEIKTTNFIYTKGYENYVLPRLKHFCIFMDELIGDENLMEWVMKSDVEIVNNYLKDKLKHVDNIKINPIKHMITKNKSFI